MRIGFTYDLRDDYLALGYGEEETAEFDSKRTIAAIEAVLRMRGHYVDRIGNIWRLAERLAAGERWDVVFNIAEGLHGVGRESQVPTLLDAFAIPYTFSDSLVTAVTLDKAVGKRVVRDQGVATAPFHVVRTIADVAEVALPYPLFVKPLSEGTGKGISEASHVVDYAGLEAACARVLSEFRQPALVETYLSGREFTVGILGAGAKAEALGVMEVSFNDRAERWGYGYANKEHYEDRVTYALADDADARASAETALAAWRALGCRDAGRIDIRLDAAGRPNFLEANPLPGLHPDRADLVILAGLKGITHAELIGRIIDNCLDRLHDEQSIAPPKVGEPRPAAPSRKALILHSDVPADAPPDEQETLQQAAEIGAALAAVGFVVSNMAYDADEDGLTARLRAAAPDIIFNLVESVAGRNDNTYRVPALLDRLGLAFTGCRAEVITGTADKPTAKHRMRAVGIATPDWLAPEDATKDGPPLGGPFILKSLREDASFGMAADSIVGDRRALAEIIADRQRRFGGSWFAERYIEGREFNVAVLDGEVLPVAEIRFDRLPKGAPHIVDYAGKWLEGTPQYNGTRRIFLDMAAEPALARSLADTALACWNAFALSGYARVDFRVDAAGQPWVLEINANPSLSRDAGFAAAAAAAGLSYEQTVARITAAGLARQAEMSCSWREAPLDSDPAAVAALVAATGVFTEDEIDVARQLVAERLINGPASGYDFIFAEQDGRLVGYSCFGPIPATDGRYDLYWIAVTPALHGRHLGRAVMRRSEQAMRRAGAQYVYIETSMRPAYAPTRKFYAACGYHKAAELTDFYRAGDSKGIFSRPLNFTLTLR